MVNLDEGKQRKRPSEPHYCVIRKTTDIKLAALRAYLDGTMSFDNSVLESLSKYFGIACAADSFANMDLDFLDHVIRQWPSENLIAIKRNFFRPDVQRTRLDSVVDVAKGVYSSLRMNGVSRLSNYDGNHC
jgi:eukaryotic translation initiation factor 2C